VLRPRWHKVLNDLWENKARTLLIVASIAIGVFAVGMITGTYVIFPEAMNQSYTEANPANIHIVTMPFQSDLVDRLEQIKGVRAAEGRRSVTLRVRDSSMAWTTIELIARDDFVGQQINQLANQEGNISPHEQEVILWDSTSKELEADIGDKIEVELPDGTIRRMPVVGTAQDPTAGIDTIIGDPTGYISIDTLEWLNQTNDFNEIYITVSEQGNDLAYIKQVSDQVQHQLEKSGREVFMVEEMESDRHPVDYIVQAVLGTLSLLGVLLVFLSGSLITNTLNSLITQQTRQIGVMKLVGAQRRHVTGMYLVLILTFGVLALIFAIPLGAWAALELSKMLASLIKVTVPQSSPLPLVPLAVGLQTVIALGVPLVAGLFPIVRGSRVTVQEAISGSAVDRDIMNKSWFDRRLEGIRWLSGPLLISLRNTFRNKGRLFLTLFTLALGGSVFIAVFNVQIALDQKVEDIAHYFNADVNLEFEKNYRIAEVRQIVKNLPGVVQVEGWGTARADVLDIDGEIIDTTIIIAPPAGSNLVEPTLLEGRWLLPGDQKAITINEAFWSDYPNLHVGDSLRLKIDGNEDDWLIVGVFQYTGIQQLFAYTNYEPLTMLTNEPGQAATYRIVTEEHSLAYQEQMSNQIEAIFQERGYQIRQAESGGELADSVNDVLGILIILLLILAMLTAAVGSIGLAGTLSMNVLERTREIGILRAIGGYDLVVIKQVMAEGLFIGLISFILACLLSFPISNVLSEQISQALFNSPANFTFSLTGFFYWGIVVLVLSSLASIIPAHNASRMTIREVLAYE
jgi:putative ABC transport system permease protein